MLDDVISCIDTLVFAVQAKQTTRMPFGQVGAANQLHILLGQAEQPQLVCNSGLRLTDLTRSFLLRQAVLVD